MDIFVGNLPWSMTDEGLQELFSPHGRVDRVKIVTDRDTGRSRGFAFVTMNDASEAEGAIAALNGTEQGGRPMSVRLAEERGGGGRGGSRRS